MPADPSQRRSPGAGRAAAGLRGVGAFGPVGRVPRETGAGPGAAAAVKTQREKTQDKWVDWEEHS